MDVVRLPFGEQAPTDADCIHIEETAEGVFTLTPSALCVGSDDAESVSLINTATFAHAEDAEAAGLAWVADVGIEGLFISTATLAQPANPNEIDKPL